MHKRTPGANDISFGVTWSPVLSWREFSILGLKLAVEYIHQ